METYFEASVVALVLEVAVVVECAIEFGEAVELMEAEFVDFELNCRNKENSCHHMMMNLEGLIAYNVAPNCLQLVVHGLLDAMEEF